MSWNARTLSDYFERYCGDPAEVQNADGALWAMTDGALRSKLQRLGLAHVDLPINKTALGMLGRSPGITAGMLARRMAAPVDSALLILQLLFYAGRVALAFNVVHGRPVLWMPQAVPITTQVGVWACAQRLPDRNVVSCLISKGKRHTKTLTYDWQAFANIENLRELARAHAPDIFDPARPALDHGALESRRLELAHLDLENETTGDPHG